jgi:hypothetical protein
MKTEITLAGAGLTVVDLFCIRNLLLAHSFDAGASGDKAIAELSSKLSNKITKLLAELEA